MKWNRRRRILINIFCCIIDDKVFTSCCSNGNEKLCSFNLDMDMNVHMQAQGNVQYDEFWTSIVKYWIIKFNLKFLIWLYITRIFLHVKIFIRKEGINFFPLLFPRVLKSVSMSTCNKLGKGKRSEIFCILVALRSCMVLLIHSIDCRLFFQDALLEGWQLLYIVMISKHFCRRLLLSSVLQMVPFFLTSSFQITSAIFSLKYFLLRIAVCFPP